MDTATLNLFAADGTPTRSFPAPIRWTGLSGFNGTHLVLHGDGEIIVLNLAGKPVQKFQPRGVGDSRAFLAHRGREMWIVNLPTHKVDRYAMP